MVPEPGEDSFSIALRYLRNAVAWNSAISYILNSVKVSPSLKDIALDFVVTPIAFPDTCAPGKYLVDNAITRMLQKLSLDSQSETAKSLIEEFKSRLPLPVEFSGTVHSEASLMDLMVASMDEMIPLPNGMKQEELVTGDGVGVFGVGKKCCWCCSTLSRAIYLLQDSVDPEIPASHGLIFPWALPTIGISVAAAKFMENGLTRIWLREMDKFARDFSRRLREEED